MTQREIRTGAIINLTSSILTAIIHIILFCRNPFGREKKSRTITTPEELIMKETVKRMFSLGLPTMGFDDSFWMSAALLYLKTGGRHPSFKCHHKSVQRGIKRYAKELLEIQDYTGVPFDDSLFWEHAVEVYKQDGEKSVKFKKLSLGAKQLIRNKAAFMKESIIKEPVKCMYCGAEIDMLDSNNPDDYLHPGISKYGDDKYCCSQCNIITSVNRALYDVIHIEKEPYFGPWYAAHKLRAEADYLEKHSDEIESYYIEQYYKRHQSPPEQNVKPTIDSIEYDPAVKESLWDLCASNNPVPTYSKQMRFLLRLLLKKGLDKLETD